MEFDSGMGSMSAGWNSEISSARRSPEDNYGHREEDEDNKSNTRGGQSRRTACDVCRERKVRCDRSEPQCGRCIRLGHKCHYTASRKTNSVDVTQALMKLHSRIAQAEARLALAQSGMLPPPTTAIEAGAFTAPWPEAGSEAIGLPPYPEVSSADTSTMGANGYTHLSNLDLDDNMVQRTLDDWSQLEDTQNLEYSLPASLTNANVDNLHNPSNGVAVPSFMPFAAQPDSNVAISSQLMAQLHQNYFDSVHPTLPMIDRQRFAAALEESAVRTEINSLNYAVAMAGAGISKDNDRLVSACYDQARHYFEEAERKVPGAQFLSIHALQALLLITYHEFKRQNFARAWMSLGRVLRLTELMALHRLDLAETKHSQPSFYLPLPKAQSSTEMEERRRTFWVAYILDTYACCRTNTSVTFHQDDISTSLPSAAAAPEFHTVDHILRLRDVMSQQSIPLPLSPFAGMSVMCGLAGVCNRHASVARQDSSTGDSDGYPFWGQHFAIDKKIDAVSECLMQNVGQSSRPHDAPLMILHLNLCAVTIYLHEIAAEKAMQASAPVTLRKESIARCENAAVTIATKLHQMQYQDSYNINLMKQVNSFSLWSLSLAARVLSQLLSNPSGNQRNVFPALEILHSTMQALDDDSGSFDDLIAEVGEQLGKSSVTRRSSPVGAVSAGPVSAGGV